MNISQQSFFSSSSSMSQTPNPTTQASLFSIKISIHKRTSVRLIINNKNDRKTKKQQQKKKKNEED
jgi:hypothetical protein